MSWTSSNLLLGGGVWLACAGLLAGCEAKCPSTATPEAHDMSGLHSRICVNSLKALDGPATTWASNGEKIFEGFFEVEPHTLKTGLPSGMLKWWYENGKQRAKIEFAPGSGGVPEGTARFWSHDGSLLYEAAYRNGQPEGRWTAWHGSGKKAFEGNFKAGRREGAWRYWYPDAAPGVLAEYKAGLPSGEWTAWKRGGQQALKIQFADGKVREIHGVEPASGIAMSFPYSAQDAYTSMDFTKAPEDKASPVTPGSMDEIILSTEFERTVKFFGALLSDVKTHGGAFSPFGRIDGGADLARAGWMKFDVVR